MAQLAEWAADRSTLDTAIFQQPDIRLHIESDSKHPRCTRWGSILDNR
jgi:hypothetical protein